MSSTARKLAPAVTVSAIFAVTAGLLQYAHWAPSQSGVGSSYDSGMFAYCGRVLAETGRLYSFCTDNKPPGVFIINAVASRFAENGLDWRSMWLSAWVAQVVTWVGLGAFLWSGRRHRHGWQIAAVGVVSTFVVIDGAVTVEMYSIPLQFAVAVLAWRILSNAQATTGYAAALAASAGACIGLLTMFRPNNGASAMLIVGSLGFGLLQGRSVWRTTIAALASATGAVVAIGLMLWAAGGFEAASGTLEFALSQGISYSETQRASRLAAALSNLVWGATMFAGFLVSISFGERWTLYRRGRGSLARVPASLDGMWFCCVAIWLVAEIAFSSASARRYPHYAQMLLVPIAILVAELSRMLSRRHLASATWRSLGWKDAARAIVVMAACVLAILPTVRYEASLTGELRRVRRNTRMLVDTLAKLGAAQSGVHMWGGPPAVYLALDLAAPVRHLAPSTLATRGFSNPAYFSETIGCIAGARPEFIVDAYDATQVGFRRGRRPSPTMEELPEFEAFRAFIVSQYRFVGRIDRAGIGLWRRDSLLSASAVTPVGISPRDCRPHVGSWRLRG